MFKTFTTEVHCTPTEAADEIWRMSARDRLVVLRALYTRFFRNDKGAGLMQMAYMANELDKIQDEDYKADVKNFVTYLYEYLTEGGLNESEHVLQHR